MERHAGRRAQPVARRDDERMADAVYRDLVGRLIAREILPGERMSIDRTSRLLGVSQTPVREALAQLESEGLVRRVHLAGYRAAPLLTGREFQQLFEMRLLLEPFAAGLAAERHTAAQARAMDAAEREMQTMAETIERLTYGEFARVDSRLHDVIAVASDNPLLREGIARLHSHIHLFRLHYHARVPRDALGEHEQLLAAIAERDAQAATAAMRTHLEMSRARLGVAFEAPVDDRGLDTPRVAWS